MVGEGKQVSAVPSSWCRIDQLFSFETTSSSTHAQPAEACAGPTPGMACSSLAVVGKRPPHSPAMYFAPSSRYRARR